MSKRVWIFNHYAAPPSIATGLRHYNFGKYLQRAGYAVQVFAASAIHNTDKNLITDQTPYIEDSSEGVPFVFLRTRQYRGNGLSRVQNMLDYYRGLFKVTKQYEKPDVILASSVHPLTCVAGIKIAKRLGVPCICEIRDLWPESIVEYAGYGRNNPVIRLLYGLEKWIYTHADQLIFTMEGGADYIREKGWSQSIDMQKIHHINNGVDLEEYVVQAKMPFEHASLQPGAFRVVYMGSLRKANGVDSLVYAFQELQNYTDTPIRLIVFGQGEELENLKRLASSLNLDTVEFAGSIPKSQVPAALGMADLNVLNYQNVSIHRFGGSQNKLFEYFAAGKPIVNTVKLGYDLVDRFAAGISLEEHTPELIAKAIYQIACCSKEQYNIYCNNAKTAASQYDSKVLTEKLIQIIRSICPDEDLHDSGSKAAVH